MLIESNRYLIGSSPSWYLSRLYVKDVQTGKSWILNCENWLAVESDDGKVCRILSISNDEELTTFNHVFSKQAVKGLMDGHIWFSVVTRPPASNFTRVQRLSCALCLLCCTMITSAMFYNMGGQGPSPFAVHIGSLVIDLKPFVIGLQSSVIIVPVNVLIVQIFRNLRPKTNKVGVDCDRENAGTAPNIQVENQSPPQGKLPHCFIFFAYALCYLASAASIFFTLLYSIQWGKETSTEWVIAMVSSFFQSVLLLQPVKVVLIAIIIALCAKKAADTKDNSDDDLVIKKSNAAEQKSSADKAMELQKKIQAIGAPPRKLNKFYRSVYFREKNYTYTIYNHHANIRGIFGLLYCVPHSWVSEFTQQATVFNVSVKVNVKDFAIYLCKRKGSRFFPIEDLE